MVIKWCLQGPVLELSRQGGNILQQHLGITFWQGPWLTPIPAGPAVWLLGDHSSSNTDAWFIHIRWLDRKGSSRSRGSGQTTSKWKTAGKVYDQLLSGNLARYANCFSAHFVSEMPFSSIGPERSIIELLLCTGLQVRDEKCFRE